jgi:structure-specific endonuclease subunit SLX1
MSWKCYLLATTDGKTQKTYVGITPDLDRRLRQHNGEIAGGAAATAGRRWERIGYVSGFPDMRAALQFEWRWKQVSRRLGVGEPLRRRLVALQTLLGYDKATTAAIPYEDWSEPPEFHVETGRELPFL